MHGRSVWVPAFAGTTRVEGRYRRIRMRRFLAALLGLLIGYPVFAVLGYFAISLFSGNHFDGSVEASMTAAFVFGPAGAIIGLIVGIVASKKRQA
jgi:cation transporter-like permease